MGILKVLAVTHLTPTKWSEDLTGAISRVAEHGDRIVLRRNRKNLAALVSMDDLEMLEDWEDVMAADKAKAESDPSKTKTLDRFLKECGLQARSAKRKRI